MKPALFKITSKKKCYLISDNLLILDIPFSKMSACVAELHDGKTDRKSLWARQVFNLAEDFCLEYDEEGEQTITMSQDGAVFVEDSPERAEIAEWLIKQLRQLRFSRFSLNMRNPKMLLHGAIASILTAVLALVAILALNNDVVQHLLAEHGDMTAFITTHIGMRAIGIVALLIVSAIMARAISGFFNGGTRIIYKKDAFDMSTYKQAKAAAQADISKRPVRVSAVSRDGHYSFARSYR